MLKSIDMVKYGKTFKKYFNNNLNFHKICEWNGPRKNVFKNISHSH